jgi:hypothetical protein
VIRRTTYLADPGKWPAIRIRVVVHFRLWRDAWGWKANLINTGWSFKLKGNGKCQGMRYWEQIWKLYGILCRRVKWSESEEYTSVGF